MDEDEMNDFSGIPEEFIETVRNCREQHARVNKEIENRGESECQNQKQTSGLNN